MNSLTDEQRRRRPFADVHKSRIPCSSMIITLATPHDPSGPLSIPFPPSLLRQRCTPGIQARVARMRLRPRDSHPSSFPSPLPPCHACPLFPTLRGASRERTRAHTRACMHVHESKGECSAPAGAKPVSR